MGRAALALSAVFLIAAQPALAEEREAHPVPTAATYAQAAQLIDRQYVRPIDREALVARFGDAARGVARGGEAAFDRCRGQVQPVKDTLAMAAAVRRITGCVEIDRLESDAQIAAWAALGTGIVATIDSASMLLSSQQIEALTQPLFGDGPQDEVQPGGIGLSLSDGADGKTVHRIAPASPARAAGLRNGETITSVDGQPTVGMTLDAAVLSLRGAVDSDVALGVRDESGAERVMTLRRKPADALIQTVTSERRGAALIITVHELMPGTTEEFQRHWTAHAQDARQLVIDLRNNEGGVLDEAISLADALLTQGLIGEVRGRTPAESEDYRARRGASAEGIPTVLLVGARTAAGAEIFAAALRDNDRALIVGEKTFGRGSIQTLLMLPGQAALKLTTGEMIRANGQPLEPDGIMPDCPASASNSALLDLAVQIAMQGMAACPATRP